MLCSSNNRSLLLQQPCSAPPTTMLCTSNNHSLLLQQPCSAPPTTMLCTSNNHALHLQQPCSAPPTTMLCSSNNHALLIQQPFSAPPTTMLCSSNNHALLLQQPFSAPPTTILCTSNNHAQHHFITMLACILALQHANASSFVHPVHVYDLLHFYCCCNCRWPRDYSLSPCSCLRLCLQCIFMLAALSTVGQLCRQHFLGLEHFCKTSRHCPSISPYKSFSHMLQVLQHNHALPLHKPLAQAGWSVAIPCVAIKSRASSIC